MSYIEDELFQIIPDPTENEFSEDPYDDTVLSAEPEDEEENFTPVRTFDDRIAYNSDFKRRGFSDYPEHRVSRFEQPAQPGQALPDSSDHKGLWTIVTVVLIIGILSLCLLLIRLIRPDLLNFLFQPE